MIFQMLRILDVCCSLVPLDNEKGFGYQRQSKANERYNLDREDFPAMAELCS